MSNLSRDLLTRGVFAISSISALFIAAAWILLLTAGSDSIKVQYGTDEEVLRVPRVIHFEMPLSLGDFQNATRHAKVGVTQSWLELVYSCRLESGATPSSRSRIRFSSRVFRLARDVSSQLLTCGTVSSTAGGDPLSRESEAQVAVSSQRTPIYYYWVVAMHPLFACTLLSIYPCATLYRTYWLPKRRSKRAECIRCGYSLRGLESGRCPECGTFVSGR